MKIITAGAAYLDIDAYAGITAYAELLRKQGISARAVSTAPLNESITNSIRAWPVSLHREHTSQPDDTFTLIDISNPEHFDTFVDNDRIDAVIDHHPGYEAYWKLRIGDGADIEPVGSVCTQIYERWRAASRLSEISETSARLLVCGILDNTLNFGAKITTPRDKVAFDDLLQIANLPIDWPARYFDECQGSIMQNPVEAIQNDTKTLQFLGRSEKISVGQCAVWDATDIIHSYNIELQNNFDAKDQPWFVNIISISEGKSYFLASDPDVQEWLSRLLGCEFIGSLAIASRLWLRKEILQAAIDIEKISHNA